MEPLSGPNPGVLLALYAFIFLIPSGDVWAHPRGASKSSVPEVLQDSDLSWKFAQRGIEGRAGNVTTGSPRLRLEAAPGCGEHSLPFLPPTPPSARAGPASSVWLLPSRARPPAGARGAPCGQGVSAGCAVLQPVRAPGAAQVLPRGRARRPRQSEGGPGRPAHAHAHACTQTRTRRCRHTCTQAHARGSAPTGPANPGRTAAPRRRGGDGGGGRHRRCRRAAQVRARGGAVRRLPPR